MTVESIKFGKPPEFLLHSEEEDIKQAILPLSSNDVGKNTPYFDCCTSPDVIEYMGRYICKTCAVVHEPILKDNYVSDSLNNNIHTEKKFNYPYQDHGCRTVFLIENLAPQSRPLFLRLFRLNKFFNNSVEANLKLANQFLFKVASQLEIPQSIYRSALHIYKKVIDAHLTVGRSIKNLMLASLYIACQQNNLSYDLEAISRESQIPEKIIRKNYRLILRLLDIRVKQRAPDYYLREFCIELGLSVSFQNEAMNLLKKLVILDPNLNANPKGFSIALIFYISKNLIHEKRVKQKILCQISKISGVTIRKYVKVLQSYLNPEALLELN
jgi:transcription initiation factor TFIIIB Brf1 subunit/transcription initiation factor TFIIB